MDINALHNEAMDLAERAILAKMRGTKTLKQIIALNQRAYEKERIVALATEDEPSRSVLLRSAITLAIRAQNYAAARELIKVGLVGAPDSDVKAELKELLAQIS